MWNLERLQMPNRSTLLCSGGALALFLLLSWLRVRPIGVFFFFLFCYWIYKTRCVFQIVAPPELHSKYTQLLQQVHDWRQQRPNMFCVISCGCLAVLAIIGHLISGSALALFILVVAAMMSTKYNFKLVKLEPQAFAWSEKLNNYDVEMDEEFLPEVNETNLFVLERASDSATISSTLEVAGANNDNANADDDDDKSDEIPSELLLADAIPDIDDSSSDEHENELLPLVKNKSKTSEIEFKRGHFKRDSSLSTTSSSSEESLSKGLKFPDHTTVDSATALPLLNNMDLQTQAQNVLMSRNKILPNLVTGLVQWTLGSGAAAIVDGAPHASTSSSSGSVPALATTTAHQQKRLVTALDSSDESDFEILENEDFK